MGKGKGISIGKLILQLALGIMLAVAGIWVFANSDKGGDAAVNAIRKLFDSKDLGNIIAVVFGILELVAGAYLILEPFIGDKFGGIAAIASLGVVILWAVAIVLIDFCGTGGLFKATISIGDVEDFEDFLKWFYQLAGHAAVLGGLIYIKE